jgi:integrin alpha FG-GAP repeat containing protein 1
MEGLIPNSQVVIVPYQPEDGRTPVTWSRQLFLQPGQWIPWVGVALVGSLIALSVIVIVLHVNEQRQDEAERRKAQHLINFDGKH